MDGDDEVNNVTKNMKRAIDKVFKKIYEDIDNGIIDNIYVYAYREETLDDVEGG
jgi:hypothetical protein